MRAKEFINLMEYINKDVMSLGFSDEQSVLDNKFIIKAETISGSGPDFAGIPLPKFKMLAIEVVDAQNPEKVVATAKFKMHGALWWKNLQAKMINVVPDYRRQGIATAVYQYVSKLGNTIKPSNIQLTPGQEMWKGFNRKHSLGEQGVEEDQLDEKWSEKYKKSINCNNPRGFSQRAHCQGRQKKSKSEGVAESFDQPYPMSWEKGDFGDVDALAKLDDGTNLHVMFNLADRSENDWGVEFYRGNSQSVTGQGDAQRVFATVLAAIGRFIKKQKPDRLFFTAVKEEDPTGSRAKLYDRLVQKYATGLGYELHKVDYPQQTGYKLTRKEQKVSQANKTKKQGVAEGKIKLSTDPNWYGAEVGDYKASGPVVNIPANRLVGFEPDDKMNQPASKANVEKIVAGLKQGAKLPPLMVRQYKNGYQVLDGHHRFWAYKLLGVKSIPVQVVPAEDIEEITKQGVAEGTESAIQKIEKKIQAKRDALGLAREQRRARGQHQQGQREIKIQAEIDRLSNELTQLKKQGVAEGDLDRFKKYIRPVVKTTPKIEKTTNPAGRTTDHVEWIVTSDTGEKRRFNSKKEAQEFYDLCTKQGVAEDMSQRDPVIRTVADFYINDVGSVHKEPLEDYVAQAKDLLSKVEDKSMKAKILDILKQAKKNPYIQGSVITAVGAILAGSVLGSAQKFGLSPTQTNMALQAILNTVIPTMVSRVNGRDWPETLKYTLASVGMGVGSAGMMENFKDGKNPQDKGDSARHGIPKNATISQLKKIRSSDNSSPRKKQLAHWQINMRQGRK